MKDNRTAERKGKGQGKGREGDGAVGNLGIEGELVAFVVVNNHATMEVLGVEMESANGR